jgi:hypothetical protein
MVRDGADRTERSPDGGQAALFVDDMAAFDAAAAAVKDHAGGDAPVPGRRAKRVKAEREFDGIAPSALHPVKVRVKMEPISAEPDGVKVKVEAPGVVEAKVKDGIPGAVGVKVKREPIESDCPFQERAGRLVKLEEGADEVDVKEEEADEVDVKAEEEADEVDVKEDDDDVVVKMEEESGRSDDEVEIINPPPRPKKKLRHEEGNKDFIDLTTSHPAPHLSSRPIRAMPPPGAVSANEWRMVVAAAPAELNQRPPDSHEWCHFKKSYATGLSTCRGRKLLDAGEVVHFAFPTYDWLYGRARVSARQAVALAEIVRFSTNRSGEVLATPFTLFLQSNASFLYCLTVDCRLGSYLQRGRSALRRW